MKTNCGAHSKPARFARWCLTFAGFDEQHRKPEDGRYLLCVLASADIVSVLMMRMRMSCCNVVRLGGGLFVVHGVGGFGYKAWCSHVDPECGQGHCL